MSPRRLLLPLVVLVVAACSNKLGGDLTINGEKATLSSCRSGAVYGFRGVELSIKGGTKLRVAATPADRQIEDSTGSGPYIFRREEWKPGSLVVYVKNPKYQPRKEPASGTAGGKRVYVERVEWHILRDAQTQINALAKGEIDLVERKWSAAPLSARLASAPQVAVRPAA